MDTKQELFTRLQQISSEQLGVEQEHITEKSTWANLGADSLDRLEMTRAVENEFKVEIPHIVGEHLNTVGETVNHLHALISAHKNGADITVEAVTRSQQWAEMLGIRTQVFTIERGFSFQPLPAPGEAGVWHFLARDNRDAVATLSVVDTTGDCQLHQRYRLKFGKNDRVARYAQLAILKPYRKREIFRSLIEAAENAVIRPNKFAVGWLLYPAAQARTSMLIKDLGFNVEAPLLTTEFGKCHVLVRRESCWPAFQESIADVETCPI